jgi:hypothetical protein
MKVKHEIRRIGKILGAKAADEDARQEGENESRKAKSSPTGFHAVKLPGTNKVSKSGFAAPPAGIRRSVQFARLLPGRGLVPGLGMWQELAP